MREYLKVKVKSLAAEARIIRLEERRAKAQKRKDLLLGLQSHRRGIVRTASRSTHLAYGFLRGRPYHAMERTTRTEPNWDAVQKMIEKYGQEDRRLLAQKFADWKDAA